MADTGMDSATSNPPYLDDTSKHIFKLLFITCLIIVSVLALLLQHVLGSLRRRFSAKLLHAIVFGAYTLSYSLVSYTLGLMQSSKYHSSEFPVWAVCLLMLLGGTDSLTTCALSDIDDWKSFYMKHLMKGALVVYILARFGPESGYQAPLWAILVVNAMQSYARIRSMRMASKSHLLGKIVKPIDDYMKQEHDGQTPNPRTMEGYRYIVVGEHSLPKKENSKEDNTTITTVEQIWRCPGSLLSSERGLRLKDVCLSMALSKMLNRRFAGFKLPSEPERQKTRDLVFGGLLAGDEPYEQVKPAERAKRAKRAFRVIEVELAFVHDLYYTRYPYLYHKVGYYALGLPAAMVILCSWLTYKLFKNLKHNPGSLSLPTTLCLMAVVTFLELFQLYLHMASGWYKVALIRSYVTRHALQRSDYFSQMITKILRILLSFKSFHPWQAKLGQYSLLQDFDCTRHRSNCLHYATLFLVDKDKKGIKKWKLVKLSEEVKRAVVDSLVTSNGHLMNGVRSLRENRVDEKLSWACATSDRPVTHTILVWHIATAICKHLWDVALDKAKDEDKKQLLKLYEEDKSAVDTASSLSQYCAYLVAFAPNLLPDHSSHSSYILDESIKDARKLLKSAKDMKSKCDKMLESAAGAATVVEQGGWLAKLLRDEIKEQLPDDIKEQVPDVPDDIKEWRLRWKVLTDFWAEMMLYVTPCEDAQAREHLEAMARGGEFITHLWALLTHAGVLKSDSAWPTDAV